MRVHAKELIGATPDVVVAESTPAAAALRQETSAVPIVFLQVGNPVGSGFVASLAHPGGNLTGFTNFEPTMGGKWLELLKEIAPPVTRAIAVFNPDTHSGQYWQTMEAAAPSLALFRLCGGVGTAGRGCYRFLLQPGDPGGQKRQQQTFPLSC